jgi:hypothetical protein
MDRPRSWWCRVRAALAPARPDVEERLAGRYATEERLAQGLEQAGEALARYPQAQSRVLAAAAHARGRALRIRRALREAGHPTTERAGRSTGSEPTAWQRLRACMSELSDLSEAYLADAHAVEAAHPRIARLLYELHREAAGDGRDLIWTLARSAGAVAGAPLEDVAA